MEATASIASFADGAISGGLTPVQCFFTVAAPAWHSATRPELAAAIKRKDANPMVRLNVQRARIW